jgi:hypothetical protein
MVANYRRHQSKQGLEKIFDLSKVIFSGEDGKLITLEKDQPFELKLLICDAKVLDAVKEKNLEAFGFLIELREGIIKEKLALSNEYYDKKKVILDKYEPLQAEAAAKHNDLYYTKYWFREHTELFVLQNIFLAEIYSIGLEASQVEL